MSESYKAPGTPSAAQQAVLDQLATAKGGALTDDEVGLVLLQTAPLAPTLIASKKLTLLQMGKHIDTLCYRHDLQRLNVARPSRAYALRQAAEIHIPPIRSAISYATALHEIGHVLGPNQDSPKTIVGERGAWRWAKSNALNWTPSMERNMKLALEWYEKRLAKLRDRSN